MTPLRPLWAVSSYPTQQLVGVARVSAAKTRGNSQPGPTQTANLQNHRMLNSGIVCQAAIAK